MSSEEETNKKINVLLRGPFLTTSGYGVHARQIAQWMFNKQEKNSNIDISFDLLPWGITSWLTNTNALNGLVGRIVQNAKRIESDYNLSIQVQLPNEWNPFAAAYNIGVTAGVETDVVNPDWVDCVNRMDLVIVPSEFTKQGFVNSAKKFDKVIKTEIKVVPESFPNEVFETYSDTLPIELETDFNFLIFGQITGNSPDNDRKNFGYTMKAFYEAFKENENVGIVIKTNSGRNTDLDRLQCMAMFSQIQSQLKYAGSKGPKVYVLHGEMSNEEVTKLYRHPKIKALLSLTRGEGFGLPILEAAANNLPVIATNWSAHTEFLNKGKWIKVEQDQIPVHESRIDNSIFIPASRWAQAREQDAISKLKKFYLSSSTPKQWAQELGKTIREEYSFESISKTYDALLLDKIK